MLETQILVRSFGAFFVALAGGALSALIGRSEKWLFGLIAVGAGTLLGVVVFSIAPESFHLLNLWQFAAAVASGYAVFSLISRHLFHVCPACASQQLGATASRDFAGIATSLMLALAIHCTVDGVALAAGHEHGGGAPAPANLDASVTAAICAHKLPEGLALGSLLLAAGFRVRKMLALVCMVESTTILGAWLGAEFFTSVSATWIAAILAHAAGGFLFLAARVFFGEGLKHSRSLFITAFSTGFAAIGFVSWFWTLRD